MKDATIILDTLIREVDAGRSVALCAIVATKGSTPQPPGAFVCVDEAAGMTGTLGGGCVEADVRRRAHQQLVERRGAAPPDIPSRAASRSRRAGTAQVTGRGELLCFTLDEEMGEGDGMICGGRMEVAVCIVSPSTGVEPYRESLQQIREGRPASLPVSIDTADGPVIYRIRIEAAPELVIAGAGHISRILADLGVRLGFRVHVVDDRGDYAHAGRFPAPIQTHAADIASTLKKWSAGSNTYIVIVTRGHKHDADALRAVLDTPARYIGMIGSRRKIDVIFQDLRRLGADEDQLRRVHTPIGLDIGAVTTDEIAVSIAAELIAVRRGGGSRTRAAGAAQPHCGSLREFTKVADATAIPASRGLKPAAQVVVEGPFPLSDAAT